VKLLFRISEQRHRLSSACHEDGCTLGSKVRQIWRCLLVWFNVVPRPAVVRVFTPMGIFVVFLGSVRNGINSVIYVSRTKFDRNLVQFNSKTFYFILACTEIYHLQLFFYYHQTTHNFLDLF
jgi:predicted membrane channel-forming protein YqfA (hemolysin III family)